MTTIPNFTDITEQVGETFVKSQQFVTETVEAWAGYAVDAMKVPSFDEIPSATELVDRAFDRYQKLVDLQRSTLKGLAGTWAA
jgi:hypothetical protein